MDGLLSLGVRISGNGAAIAVPDDQRAEDCLVFPGLIETRSRNPNSLSADLDSGLAAVQVSYCRLRS
jgi:hypothetical protein